MKRSGRSFRILVLAKTIILSFSCLLVITGCQGGLPGEPGTIESPPNIQIITAFAGKAVRFTHAHINSAVCQPCRQSLLTGLYPHNNGAEIQKMKKT